MKLSTIALAILTLVSLSASASKYKACESAGQGYITVTEKNVIQGDGLSHPWLLMKEGKVVPGIQSAWPVKVNDDGLILIVREENGHSFCGLLDKNGKTAVPAEYEYISYLGNGLYALGEYKNHLIGPNFAIWDSKTRTATNPIKGNCDHGNFSEGLVQINRNGKIGFINKNGSVAITPKYDYACDFNEGLAAVLVGKKWGFINKSGRFVIPAQYDDDASWYDDDNEPELRFTDGVAPVMKRDRWGVINKRGLTIVPFTTDGSITIDSVKREIVTRDYSLNKSKIYNLSGKLLRTEKIRTDNEICPGLYVKEAPSGFGVVNSTGKVIIPHKYSYLTAKDGFIICQVACYENNMEGSKVDIYDTAGNLIYADIAKFYIPFFVG